MEREQKSVEQLIETPFGTMLVIVQGARLLYVRNPDGQEVQVNNVLVRVRVQLEDYGKGFELQCDKHNATFHALSVERWTGGNIEYGNAAKRDKVTRTLLPLVNAWAKSNPRMLRDGELASVIRQLDTVSEELLALDTQRNLLVASIDTLLKRADEIKKGGAL